jgi:hypothetical protein
MTSATSSGKGFGTFPARLLLDGKGNVALYAHYC